MNKCLRGHQTRKLAMAAAIASIASTGSYTQAAESFLLEEIVVTAQKRSQSVLDVGLAVTAFDGDQLNKLGAGSLQDVTSLVPNVELFDEYGSGQPTWVIRGVGLQDFNANNTPTAAIYVDEVYQTSNVMGGVGLYDLERVEVLKGPQGGLYGRNTSGGAVQIISRRPQLDEEMNGYLRTSYGSWGNTEVEGALGALLSNKVAGRVAGKWNKSNDGWQDSLVDGDSYGEKDLWSMRAQLLIVPTDDTEVLLKVFGGENSSETMLGVSTGLYDPATGGFCGPVLAGQQDSGGCVDLAGLQSAFFGGNASPPSVQSSDGSRTLSNPINQLDNQWSGVTAQVNVDFDTVTLTSISAYTDFEYGLMFDYDGSSLIMGHQDANTQFDVWSQELRLASNDDSPVTWLVGALYASDTVTEDRYFNFRDNLFFLDAVGLTGLGDYAQSNLNYEQETTSWAVYGQLEYQLSDELRLNTSLRYTDEEKDYKDGAFRFYLLDDVLGVPGAGDVFTEINRHYELEDNWSGKVSVDWTPNNNLLMYASVSRGFKAGGFYGGFPSETADVVNPYSEETVLAYELGFKQTLLDGAMQFNGAVFIYDYRDVQGFTTVFSPLTNNVVTRLDNIADATHTGAEFDLTWAPLDGLTLLLSAGWLDTELDSDNNFLNVAGETEAFDGLSRNYAPEWSAFSMARYEWSLGDGFVGVAQADYSYRSDLISGARSPIDNAVKSVDGYGLLNARLELNTDDEVWSVALVGRNMTDKVYRTSTTSDDVGSYMSMYGQPRSWSVEAQYDF